MSAGPAPSGLRHQLPLLAWLVVRVDPAVGHVLLGQRGVGRGRGALLVMLLLPLPPVVGGTRVRPLSLLRFVGHFLVDLAVSGAQVAWRALGPSGVQQGAIVRVQLRADSDLLLTAVAETRLPGARLAGARPRPGGAADRRPPAARRRPRRRRARRRPTSSPWRTASCAPSGRRRTSPRWARAGGRRDRRRRPRAHAARQRCAAGAASGWPAARRCWTGSSPPTPCW